MKRCCLIACCLLISLVWMLLPIPMPGDTGAFNVISGLVWCNSPWVCVHEQGHALDRSLGWPSQTKEFGNALEFYTLTEILTGEPSSGALGIFNDLFWPNGRWFSNPRAEAYANIYADAGGQIGNIPAGLQQFYTGE